MYYLGKHGSDASRREYDRVIAEFIANGRQSFYDQEETPSHQNNAGHGEGTKVNQRKTAGCSQYAVL